VATELGGDFPVLVEAARGGDARAWETLWRECRPYLFAVARRSLGNSGPKDCSSIVQEGMVRAFEHIHQFRGQTKAELLGWMSRIVANRVHDQIETRQHSPIVPGVDAEGLGNTSGASPSAPAVRRERAARVLQALEALPADYQEVIRLRYFDDLGYEEIAARMSRTNQAVRSICVRAVRRLGEELGDEP
jgi:RNA polymerase sigma-70 factor (ECF subfamily)